MIPSGYVLESVSGPVLEPLTVAEAKLHCRVEIPEDDALFADWIRQAREMIESALDVACITQTLKLYLDEFPEWELVLPRPPLRSVSGISYVDSDGVTQTLSASLYRVDAKSRPGRITPAWGEAWPATRQVTNAVNVTFVAGHGDSGADCPAAVRQAIRLCVGKWNEFREDLVAGSAPALLPSGVEALLMSVWDGRYS
jgi:uncharacterized phiE125 gp8 family phage protein